MSDTYISIVPIDINEEQVDCLAERFTNFLKEKIIINENNNPGASAPLVTILDTKDFLNISPNNFIIEKGLQVKNNGGNGLEKVQCTKCSYDISPFNWIDYGFHRQVRKVTKTKGAFTNDMALLKLVYLATKNIQKKWTTPLQNWSLIIQQLYIRFEDRVALDLATKPQEGSGS